jgi:hypothetical protein
MRARRNIVRPTLATRLVGLVDGLDDADGNGLPHVTDSEAAERRVLVVGLNAHGLGRNKLGNARVARLDELGVRLKHLTVTTVDLLNKLRKLASNVRGVAVKHGCVTGTDLTGVVEDDDLGVEGSSFLGGVVLGVGSDVTTTNILDRDVLNVEADVITGRALLELLVVHLNGLDFSGDVRRSEGNDHAGLDDTSLDTTDGYRSDTTDLVHILERETEGLVGGTDRGLDGVDGVEQSLALDDTTLGLLGPTLVPGHAIELYQHLQIRSDKRNTYLLDSSNMLSPCQPEIGTNATAFGL